MKSNCVYVNLSFATILVAFCILEVSWAVHINSKGILEIFNAKNAASIQASAEATATEKSDKLSNNVNESKRASQIPQSFLSREVSAKKHLGNNGVLDREEKIEKATQIITDALLDYAVGKRSKNQELDEKEIEDVISKAGYGSFLQHGQSKGIKEWFGDAFKKASDVAKGFASSGIVQKVKETVGPLLKKLLKEAARQIVPSTEQSTVDVIKRLPHAKQAIAAPLAAAVFRKINKYIGKKGDDSPTKKLAEEIGEEEADANEETEETEDDGDNDGAEEDDESKS